MTLGTAYLALLATALGLIVGSFLNVVIYRLPRRESLSWPGSHCPQCGHPIRWYDNVPVVSWLLLRRRCRDCGEPIPWRYPLVELLTGVAFLAAFLVYGPEWRTVQVAVFLAALIAVSFIDLDHRIIPDRIVLPGAAVGLLTSILLDPSDWWVYCVAALGAAGFLLVIGLIWPGGMGFGDVKLALMMGAFLGGGVIVALFLGFLAGGLSGVLLLATGKKKRRDKIPFGPFLSLGGAVTALWGSSILDWYLSLF
jgi:leader peptidase (prepilin peptidase) / N-methyltransferase